MDNQHQEDIFDEDAEQADDYEDERDDLIHIPDFEEIERRHSRES